MKFKGIVTKAQTRNSITLFDLEGKVEDYSFYMPNVDLRINNGEFVNGETVSDKGLVLPSGKYMVVSNLEIYNKPKGKLLHTYSINDNI